MRAENIISSPIKTTYKVGVYSALIFVSLSLTAFIVWSFSCVGRACYEVVTKLV